LLSAYCRRYAFVMVDTTTAATVDPLAQLTAIKALESARRAQHKSAAAVQKAASTLKNANQAHKATAGLVTAAFEQLAAAGLTPGMLRDLGISVPPLPTKTAAAAPPIGGAAAEHHSHEGEQAR